MCSFLHICLVFLIVVFLVFAMDEVTKNFLISKAHALKGLALGDIDFLESLMRKTAEDILELRGMLTPLLFRREAVVPGDFHSLDTVVRISIPISHINVVIGLLQQRREVMGCCLRGMKASSSELNAVIDTLKEIPVVDEVDDAGSDV